MVDTCSEGNFWWFKRIFRTEVNIKEEYAAFIYGARRSENSWNPFIHVVTFRTGTAIRGWINSNFGQLFLNSFCGGRESFWSFRCIWSIPIFGRGRATSTRRCRGWSHFLIKNNTLDFLVSFLSLNTQWDSDWFSIDPMSGQLCSFTSIDYIFLNVNLFLATLKLGSIQLEALNWLLAQLKIIF